MFTFYKEMILLIFKVLLPILFSFFLSYSLYPCINLLKRKFTYNTSCIIITIGIIFFIIIFIYISISIFTKELPIISKDIISFLSNFSFYKDISTNLSIENGINIINNGTKIITKIVIVIILFICFLFNIEKIVNYLKKYELLNKINNDLYYYYKGFYIATMIEIIEYLIIYLIIGHPYYLFLSFLNGFSNIIPTFGAILSNLIALVSSYNISKSLFIKTSIVMIVVPLINSYFIEPKIYNKTLKISFISIIISCFIFGTLFGIAGIIFAMPLFLIIKNLFNYIKMNKFSIKKTVKK